MEIVPLLSLSFRALDTRQFRSKLIVKLAEIHVGDLLVRLGRVHSHVEDTKVQLTEVEQSIIDVLGGDELLNEVVRNLLFGLVVRTK